MPSLHRTAEVDPIVDTLNRVQVQFLSFSRLTGVDDLRKLTFNRIRKTRERIAREDQELRLKNEHKDLSCLPWTVGAFWLNPQGLNDYFSTVEKIQTDRRGSAVQPMWQMTLRELLNQHMGNLRQLVLSLAYDWAIIELLSGKLASRDHLTLSKEITRCEQTVQDLIQQFLSEQESLVKLMTVNIEIYERACLTERMIRSGSKAESSVAGTLKNLKRAQERARELCRQELAIFDQLLTSIRGKVQEELRQGEWTQLTRTNRLNFALFQTEELPGGYATLASLVAFERKRLTACVLAREKELGATDEGNSLIAQSQALDKAEATVGGGRGSGDQRILKRTNPGV